MKTRKLGQIEVSPIGMGCMGFSHGYGKVPEESYSIEAIHRAHEFGCTFFDTAEGYGREQFYPGHNEELVGKALEPFRKEVVLATKFHISNEEKEQQDFELGKAIRRHLEASMKRLRTDYVDLYYLHRVNEQIPVEDVAAAMGQLIKEGLIRGWGMSQVDGATLDRAHKVAPVSAVQNLYNMLERDCETDIFPYCLENDIGVVPFSPIASGFLSGKITVDTKFEKEDDVRNWVPQLSKAWMLHKYPNVVPIPGSKNQERILENLGAWNVELTDEEFTALEQALGACTIHGHRGHVESENAGFRVKKEEKA